MKGKMILLHDILFYEFGNDRNNIVLLTYGLLGILNDTCSTDLTSLVIKVCDKIKYICEHTIVMTFGVRSSDFM